MRRMHALPALATIVALAGACRTESPRTKATETAVDLASAIYERMIQTLSLIHI